MPNIPTFFFQIFTIRTCNVNISSMNLEDIAFLDNRLYHYRRVGTQCTPQIGNLHVQRQRVGIRVVSPNLVEDGFPFHQLVLASGQQLEYFCLPRGYDDSFIAVPQFVLGIIKDDGTDRNGGFNGISVSFWLFHLVYHVLQKFMPDGIDAFLYHYCLDKIIQATKQDDKEQDAANQLPKHGLQDTCGRDRYDKADSFVIDWVRLIV